MNNFCQECGSPRDENAKFCPNCGFKFHQEAKEEIEPTKEVEAPKEIKETKDTLEIPQYENLTSQETQAPKIGGWLYLVAFGLIVSLLLDVGALVKFFKEISLVEESMKLEYINGKIDIFGIRITLGIYLIITISLLLLLFLEFYSAFAFFTKSKNTRFLMLLLYGFSFVVGVISFVFWGQENDSKLFSNPIREIVSPIIWFLYFFKSQRVKETFVLDFSKKQKWFRVGLSSIVPTIAFIVFLVKSGAYMSDLDEAKKKHIADLTSVRELFENPNAILEGLRKRKEEVIRQEIQILAQEYSLKNKNLNTKSEIINFIYNNPEYSNLFQGIVYFCGLDCSSIPQDLEKSYYYLNNLPYNQKEEIAMFLAKMELYGIGTKQSLANAVRNASYATSLDKASQATQYYYFGLGYLYGEYYEKNIDKAIDCLKKSADLGDSSSAFLSAILMATEPKGRYNDQTIIHYFKRAILLNNMVAERYLAYYYYNNNEYDLAKQTLQQCSKTNPECQTAYQELFK